jgi:pimeloyl-ACP methyl ester carboxylesterase
MIQRYSATSVFVLFLLVVCPRDYASEASPAPQLQTIRVRGAELHYRIFGEGPTIIFVHGGLADYREWQPVAAALSKNYRTIVYSRRYNFPNTNEQFLRDFSAATEAEDLAELIDGLKIKNVHVAGASYGAYTALMLALRHPHLVNGLILAEAPLMGWLKDIPEGPAVYQDFMNRLWMPVSVALKNDQSDQAIKTAVSFFMGAEDTNQVPPEVIEMIRSNLKEWKVLTASTNFFPPVSRQEVHKIRQPVLMLSGGKSYQIGKLLDPEIERQLQNVQRVIVPDGTHDLCSEFPESCSEAILKFLASH